MDTRITLSHRLILPEDANHYGTLYAGSLLRIALEAAYAAAFRLIGNQANLVLRRVLSIECLEPVPVGSLVELQGAVLQVRQAYLVVGLVGTPLSPHAGPWMDGLMGFAQVDAKGRPTTIPAELTADIPDGDCWRALVERLEKLAKSRI